MPGATIVADPSEQTWFSSVAEESTGELPEIHVPGQLVIEGSVRRLRRATRSSASIRVRSCWNLLEGLRTGGARVGYAIASIPRH